MLLNICIFVERNKAVVIGNSSADVSIQADIAAVSRIPIVGTILEVVCRTTGMGFAAIARVTDEKWVACSVRDEISFGLIPGSELQLETTICHEIRQNGEVVIINHVAIDERFANHHTPAMYGFQSYISVPIILKNGEFFGTLCAIDPNPAILETPEITGMFKLFTDLISFHLYVADKLILSENKVLEEQQISNLREEFNKELTVAVDKLAIMNQVLLDTERNLQASVKQLTDSNDKLQQAIDTGNMGIWSIDPETQRVNMSDFIKNLFGFPLDREIQMEEIVNAIHPDYQKTLTDTLSNAIEKHQPSDITYPIIKVTTGEKKWVRATGKVFVNADGKATEYSGLVIDVTEQITTADKPNELNQALSKSNEQLSEANERLIIINAAYADTQENLKKLNREMKEGEAKTDQIISKLPAHVVVLYGPDQLIQTTNESLLRFWNKTKEQVIGKPMLEVFPELINQPFPNQWKHVLETGETISNYEKPVTFNTPDGGKRLHYVDYYYQPLEDLDGNRSAILATIIDVTDKVLSRNAVEEAETKLRLAIESSNLGTWYIDSQTREFIPSPLLKEFFGYYADETMHYEDALKCVREDYRERVTKAIKTAVIQGESYDLEYPIIGHHNYKLRWVRATGKQYKNENDGRPLHLSGTMMDITEQVIARQAIAESEARYRQAIESGALGTYSLDPFTYRLTISNRFREIFGFPMEGEVAIEDFFSAIDTEYHQMIRNSLMIAFDQRLPSDLEYRITNLTTMERKWVRATGKMFYDEGDKPVYFSGMLMDITERKMDDIRKNDFIGMVSHELKTPLTSLNAYVQMLQARAKKNEDEFTSSALEKVNTQVKKMSGMINGFLNISRLESGKIFLEKYQFNLNELLEEMIAETRFITSTHVINLNNFDSVNLIADPDKIASVISNLLSNAVKYSPKGKKIDVSCQIIDNMAKVSITDDGIGIKPEDIKKLFDRYYRVESNNTKHISGFGIGLYLSAEIIRRHDGQIGVESEIGVGSTFWFTLPL